MTWKIFDNATSLMSMTHKQIFGQIELGDQNSIKTKIWGSKSWFLK
jgi:hypothetical protein